MHAVTISGSKFKHIKKITDSIETLANNDKIKNAFKVGKVNKKLLNTVGIILKSDDIYANSRALFKLAEYYDGSLENHYKVNLPKPNQHKKESAHPDCRH